MKKINLKNQVFGHLTVVDIAPNQNNRTAWYCICDCGNECIATTKNLRNGSKQSCGCANRVYKDIQPGCKINLLTPLEQFRKNNRIYWKCQCDCGNITEVLSSNLKSGQVKSCGCLRRQVSPHRLDLTGQKFGFLTAIKYDEEKSKNNRSYWICKCECGNITSILRENLTAPNRYPSCGCQTRSRGELIIEQLLQENGISYKKEQTFDTCINPKTNTKLRFDFYVEDTYLIEFDGEQHFISKDWREPLEEIQYRDAIKNQWCKDNGIPLIRIPYTQLSTLTIDDLLLSIE